jgi:hypothetical protein
MRKIPVGHLADALLGFPHPEPVEGRTTILQQLRKRLRLPLIAAPMFLVSGIELVAAACKGRVIGAFPTANCRGAARS